MEEFASIFLFIVSLIVMLGSVGGILFFGFAVFAPRSEYNPPPRLGYAALAVFMLVPLACGVGLFKWSLALQKVAVEKDWREWRERHR